MKYTFLAVALLLLLSCGVTVPVNDEPVIDPTFENVTACKHKYSPEYNFTYHGQMKAYQKEMFGETVFVYEYMLVNGKQLFLSGNDVVNFICTRQNL